MRRLFIVLFLCTVGLYAAVIINDNKQLYNDFALHYFYDESNQLTIDEIEKKDFTDLISNQFTKGYRYGTAWFKIDITNKSNHTDLVLYFTEPFWTTLDLYSKKNAIIKYHLIKS